MKNLRLGVLFGLVLFMLTGVGLAQEGGAEEVGSDGSGAPVGGEGAAPVGGPAGEPVPAPAPAPKIPRTLVEKAAITVSGTALARGEIAIVVETSNGQSHESRIGVVAKMKDKEIAQMLARDLQFAMSQYLDFKVSGNKIKIDRVKKDKTTTFTVRVVSWTVFDVGFIVARN